MHYHTRGYGKFVSKRLAQHIQQIRSKPDKYPKFSLLLARFIYSNNSWRKYLVLELLCPPVAKRVCLLLGAKQIVYSRFVSLTHCNLRMCMQMDKKQMQIKKPYLSIWKHMNSI